MIGTRFAMAAAALGLSATAAFAVPAISEADLNMRSGPGTGYPVVGVIERGASVDVGGCSGSWCRVNYGGTSGWASQNYLDIGGSAGYAAPPATVYVAPDDYDYGYDYGAPYYDYGYGYGPSVGVQVWRGGRRGGHWAHQGRRNDHVGRGNWHRPAAGNNSARTPGFHVRGNAQGRMNFGSRPSISRQGTSPHFGGRMSGGARPSVGRSGGDPRMGRSPRGGGNVGMSGGRGGGGGGMPHRRGS